MEDREQAASRAIIIMLIEMVVATAIMGVALIMVIEIFDFSIYEAAGFAIALFMVSDFLHRLDRLIAG